MPTFDKAYYQRFYGAARTRALGPADVARLATVVTTIIESTYGPIETAMDVGAGTGLWRDWFARRRPGTRYRSTDVSAYACERYGHERRDIVQWRARGRFDLVICHAVLPHLNAADARKALANLAAMTRGFLYLEAVTTRDLDTMVDPDGTDMTVHRRPGSWYRRQLRPHFRQVGYGLWVRRDAPASLWELECGAE